MKRGAVDVGPRRIRRLRARHFVTIDLNKVVAVDGTALKALSETHLHENDPRAIQYLRAFRDAGADVIWIRGARSRRDTAGPSELLLGARAGEQLVEQLITDPPIRRHPQSLTDPTPLSGTRHRFIDQLA